MGNLGANVIEQHFVVEGNIEVGEHEVLPHHDAQFVTTLMESIGLIRHGSAYTDHVHARGHHRVQGVVE
jgi:hypothetical protein